MGGMYVYVGNKYNSIQTLKVAKNKKKKNKRNNNSIGGICGIQIKIFMCALRTYKDDEDDQDDGRSHSNVKEKVRHMCSQ